MADQRYVSEFTGPEIDEGVRLARQYLPPEKFYSNPNLLDNPWFTVAQAGYGANHGSVAYAADRWILVSGTVSYSGGLILNGTIRQKLEYTPDGDVTASVMMVTGTATILYDSANNCVDITSNGGKIKAAKLERGSVSTLANDSTPAYATELAKCKRYFVNYGSGIFSIMMNGGDSFLLSFTDLAMRTAPALSMGDSVLWIRCGSIDKRGLTVTSTEVYTATVTRPVYRIYLSDTPGTQFFDSAHAYLYNVSLSADL